MKVYELRRALSAADVDQNAEIHVVYHGYEQPSFRLAASNAYEGASVDAFLIIVEEPRESNPG